MIYVPFALRLHAFGLQRLHDPNWTGMDLYDKLKRYMRGRGEPQGVLFKTMERGVLWLLGGWLFDDLLSSERLHRAVEHEEISGEYLLWHLDEVANFLGSIHGHDHASVESVLCLTQTLGDLYQQYESIYFEVLDDVERQKELLEAYEAMIEANRTSIEGVRPAYAVNYADRVFHDRQLCSYISQLMLLIGIDGGVNEGEEPRQWVDRCSWPEWAKEALRARERGKCANCCRDLVLELADDPQIDHIVPISRGGTNDLVNLQMLCAPCNRRKSDKGVPVRNSIPPYLTRRLPSDVDQS